MAANASTNVDIDPIEGISQVSPGEALTIVRRELFLLKIKGWASLIGLICLTIASGVINNVSYYEMGQKMKGIKYAPFYIYLASIWYSMVYGIVVLVRSKDKIKIQHWRWYLVLGIFCSMGSILCQFSNPFVDGNLQSLFGLIVLPGTVIGNRLFLGRKVTLGQMAGLSILLVGEVFAVLPPMIANLGKRETIGQNNIVACAAFIVGILSTGSVVDVIQQKIFLPPLEIDIWVQLFFGSLIACIFGTLTIFLPMLPFLGSLSLTQVGSDQRDSFLCLFQTHPLPQGCEEGSPIWVVLFLVSSTIYYYAQSKLVQSQDSIFQGVVLVIIVPISCAIFTAPLLGGEAFTFYIIISLLLVVIGAIVFRLATAKPCIQKTDEIFHRFSDRFKTHPNYGTNE